jgi:hypothetical protein
MSEQKFPMNTWPTPSPLGVAGAIETLSTIAAPLLAGFSFTLLVLVIQSPEKLRWPDVAAFGLTITGVLMITAVQCGFWARLYSAKPSEAIEWHPDFPTPEGRKAVREDMWRHAQRFKTWSRRARVAYNSGIVVLFLAVSALLVPKTSFNKIPVMRWLVIVVPLLGATIELGWAILDLAANRQDHPSRLAQKLLYPTRQPPEERYAASDLSQPAPPPRDAD